MKVFIFVTLFLVVSQAVPGNLTVNSELNDEWEIFKTKFNKQYEPLTEVTRRIIWEENLKYIRQHNLAYDLGKHTYSLGLNKYSDLTDEEFNDKFTLKGITRLDSKGFDFMAPENMGPLPSSVDWRKKGYVTPVKDQTRKCGSCYAFSATGALEGQHFRKTKHLVSLSEQQLVDCSESFHNHGCFGGNALNSFEYVIVNGIESEEEYPYREHGEVCKYNKSKVVTKISSYAKIRRRNESDLAVAVATVGPVSVAIDVHKSFRHYNGICRQGIYNEPHCSSYHLTHAVLAVGYGSDNGVNYWIVKNSWGFDFGTNGYIYMSKDKNNQCGIASYASYPLI